MISKRRFVDKLRKLNYVFKEKLHFNERYRLKGGTHVIHVPVKDNLDEDYVRLTLRQAKMSKEDIEQFILDANA